MDFIAEGAMEYLQMVKKDDIMSPDEGRIQRQIFNNIMEKHVRPHLEKDKLENVFFDIIIPVVLMIFTLSMDDSPISLKLITTALVVFHIIFSTKRAFIP